MFLLLYSNTPFYLAVAVEFSGVLRITGWRGRENSVFRDFLISILYFVNFTCTVK